MWASRPSWPQLRDVDDRWVSSDELESRSRDVALRLLGAGLQSGDRFVLSGASSAALVVTYVGALRAGLVVVPLNTGYTRAEVTRIVRDARPSAAAVDDRERGLWIAAACAESIPVMNLALSWSPESGASLAAGLDRARSDDVARLDRRDRTTSRCSSTRPGRPGSRRARRYPRQPARERIRRRAGVALGELRPAAADAAAIPRARPGGRAARGSGGGSSSIYGRGST